MKSSEKSKKQGFFGFGEKKDLGRKKNIIILAHWHSQIENIIVNPVKIPDMIYWVHIQG